MKKIILVTKSQIRHQKFLSFALSHLSGHKIYPFVQGDFNEKKFLYNNCKIILGNLIKKLGLQYSSPYQNFIKENLILSNYSPDSFINLKNNIKKIEKFVYFTKDINSDESIKKLLEIRPDLVIVFGSKLLNKYWIDVPKFGTINFHYGILPYYRSSNCTQFAIHLEDFNKIGFTLHYMDKGVDTGRIIHKENLDIKNFRNINCLIGRIYERGIIKLVDLVKKFDFKKKFPSKKQTFIKNSLYRHKDYNDYIGFSSEFKKRLHDKEWPFFQKLIEKKIQKLNNPNLYSRIIKRVKKKKKLSNGIYIFLYHSIIDENKFDDWELAYKKVATSKKNFESHLEFLNANNFHPLNLSKTPDLLKRKDISKKYFVITFDDAYTNVYKNTYKILKKYNTFPTIFVNPGFCGEKVYYRVLLSCIYSRKKVNKLREIFKRQFSQIYWSDCDDTFFNQIKKKYFPYETERVIEQFYSDEIEEKINMKVHYNLEDLRFLVKKGWEIGNHTWSHMQLNFLKSIDVKSQVKSAENFFQKNNIKTIPWLSYPNGRSNFVNNSIKEYLKNLDYYGIFAGGGINRLYSKTEWLRIPVGNESKEDFSNKVFKNSEATNEILENFPSSFN